MPNRTNYKNGRSTKSKPVTAAGVVAPKPVDVDSVEDVEAPIILPYLEEDEGPPIPIPVPRSQTPQLVVLQEEYTPPQQQRYEEVFEAPLPLAVDEPAHNQQQREYEGALKALETPPPRPVLHVEDQRIGSHSRRYDDDFENALDNPVPMPEPRQQPRRTPRPTVNVHTTPPVPAFQVQVPDLHDPDPDPELAPDRFSYAYGFTPASPSRSPSSGSRISSQLRSPPRSPPRVSAPGSGLARTIRAQAVSPSPSPSRIGQGFVPTPAVPVVDLGTAGAGVEYRVPVGDGDGYENVQYRGALKGKAPREEEILWARWDEVVLPTNRRSTRLLLVAYPSTLRIWDTTDLENVVEVLRLPIADMEEGGNEERNEDDGPMLVHAAVLPDTAGNVGLA
ncbi:hypothetical protein C0991_011822 [Blastosporella zonata]|nr:hypothetical protein C0991_011822 [Blastosporella zonata]